MGSLELGPEPANSEQRHTQTWDCRLALSDLQVGCASTCSLNHSQI